MTTNNDKLANELAKAEEAIAELETKVAFQEHTIDALNEALQEILDDEDTIVDEYGVEMSEIILTVGSDSKGTVGFSELNIEYDVKFEIKSGDLIACSGFGAGLSWGAALFYWHGPY